MKKQKSNNIIAKNTKKIFVFFYNLGKIKYFNINKYWSQDRIEKFLFLEKDFSQNNITWGVVK